jgi:NADH dehydrogenase FAD-containing subunit
MSQKNVVIVGGGYAGINSVHAIEKILPKTHRIVLVDEQDFMNSRIGAARASTAEDLSEEILIPYDKLFKSDDLGVFVHASVAQIMAHSVVLASPDPSFGSEIPFDYLVRRNRSVLIDRR